MSPEMIYKTKISQAVQEILSMCKEHGLSAVCAVSVPIPDGCTTYTSCFLLPTASDGVHACAEMLLDDSPGADLDWWPPVGIKQDDVFNEDDEDDEDDEDHEYGDAIES